MCDTLDRLGASADRIAALDAELKTERGRRNELVAAARDDGHEHPWAEISKTGRLAPSRCHAIATEQAA